MRLLAPDIPPHVAEAIRGLPPDVKRSVRQSIRALAQTPEIGATLVGELSGLCKYRVRRFRIVYQVDRSGRRLRIIAVGHRAVIYDDLSRVGRQWKKK